MKILANNSNFSYNKIVRHLKLQRGVMTDGRYEKDQ